MVSNGEIRRWIRQSIRDAERFGSQRYGGGNRGSASFGGSCSDCGGTGDCPHCNNGYYERHDGTRALCGACRGRLKCHMCRGNRRSCSLPKYGESRGGGGPCQDCMGSMECRHCEGTGLFTLRDDSKRACRTCHRDPGKCYPCKGTGKEPPTHYSS